MRSFKTDEEGREFMAEIPCDGNFNQNDVFSYTITKDEDGYPDAIVVVSNNGVQLKLEYNEDTAAGLASNFRQRNIL